MLGKTAVSWIEENKTYLINISDKIWEYAELAYKEFKSSSLLINELKAEGFDIETNVAGIHTAFKASWGQGKPVIGLLAEYDALPNLSQNKVPYKDPVQQGAPGHGCGHNLFGTAVLGAAIGLKKEMEKDNLSGTIVVFGCPAEELLEGKVFMSKTGCFDELDVALTWHPGIANFAEEGSASAMNSVKFNFYGKSAHAASAPEDGRSALDAVELMDVGANYLREHICKDARLHYSITHGGTSPNIVPDYAQVWYYIRSTSRADVEDIYQRLVNIAKGAASMTGTRMEIEFLTGVYDVLINYTLVNLIHDCMVEIGAPEWSKEEQEFAAKIAEGISVSQKKSSIITYTTKAGLPHLLNKNLPSGVLPVIGNSFPSPGSTDVADVSWIVPTGQCITCCRVIGSAGHSWQATATSGMGIGHKGMIYSAKTLATTASVLIRNPDLVKKAQEEFVTSAGGARYKSPLPESLVIPKQ